MLAYDVTDEKTYQNIEDWITSIYENTQTCQVIQKVLLANKIDLPQDEHNVSKEKGLALANRYGINFYETSAKDGTGVSEAFRDLAMQCYQYQKTTAIDSQLDADAIRLDNIPVTKKQERRCCSYGGESNKTFSP